MPILSDLWVRNHHSLHSGDLLQKLQAIPGGTCQYVLSFGEGGVFEAEGKNHFFFS